MQRIRFIILVVISAALAGCVHHEPRPTEGLFEKRVQVIGHRGAQGVAPENTMAAFQVAADLGVPFELDTMLSGSGDPVVIHDYTVERTTNGRGKVASLSLAELQKLDAGSHFDGRFRRETVPSLEQVLKKFAPRVKVDVEVKFEGPRAEAVATARAIIGVIERTGTEGRVFVTAFNPYMLEEFKKHKPELIRGQLYGTFEKSEIAFYKKVALRNLLLNEAADPDILAVEDKMVDAQYVREYHALGYKIAVWTVNDPERLKQLMQWGVDGIITDYPARALKIAADLGL